MKRIASLLVALSLLTLPACKSTDASTGPAPAASGAEEDSRALLLGLADVSRSTDSCAALVTALEGQLRTETARIARIAAATEPSTGELTAEQQEKVVAFATRARQCANTPGAAALADGIKPLQASRVASASGARGSSCNCDDFCVTGWKTWAETSAMTLACLAGDNIACCTAAAIASHSACMKTYCPNENCCLDVPVSVPQHGP